MKFHRCYLPQRGRFSAALVSIFSLALLALVVRAAPLVQTEVPSKPYQFTYDWVTSNIPVWEKVLDSYRGRPDIHYLEVGVFEGRSAIWMLENVLTHPSSTLTGVDFFPENIEDIYLANLRLSGFADKTTTIKGLSQIELRRLQPDSYDFIYIDGGHTADMVMADAVLCWDLLKTGGLLIFDDYEWKRQEYPDDIRPGVAIDAFITAHRNYLEIVHRDWQLIVRKIQGPDLRDPYRTVLGEHEYAWQSRELRRRSDDQAVDLSDTEREVLETLIRSRSSGRNDFVVSPSQALDKNLQALRDRLPIHYEVRLLGDAGVSWWMAGISSLAALLLGVSGAIIFFGRRRGGKAGGAS